MYRWRRRLARWVDPETPSQPDRPEGSPGRTGLVLAGGGARASFEIGALQYLYRHQNLDPDVISGT